MPTRKKTKRQVFLEFLANRQNKISSFAWIEEYDAAEADEEKNDVEMKRPGVHEIAMYMSTTEWAWNKGEHLVYERAQALYDAGTAWEKEQLDKSVEIR